MRSNALQFERRLRPAEPGYECIADIGSGGYGRVYLFSRDSAGSRDYVAGKFIYRDVFESTGHDGSDSAYERAFEGLRRFRSLTSESPYLLRISDVRQRPGYFCYFMELADDVVSGRAIDPGQYKPKSLKNELERSGQRQRLPVRRSMEIAVMLARGLQLLHHGGFTHRDVRPSNIIFVNGTPKLADIDLLADEQAALTSYIPKHYAAPEGSHSSRADIFSFGKTLYEMATGASVKSFPSLPPEIRHWADHQEFLALNKIIGKACACDVRKRYASIDKMLQDLESICA